MGLFTRQRAAAPRREPTLAAAPVENRDAGRYSDGWGVLSGLNGHVGPGTAEGLAAVVACVDAISGMIASLPAAVFKSDGQARIEVPGHPVAALIRAPNSVQTWPGWVEWTLSQTLLHGQSVSVIERDAAGRPVALWPVPWTNITLQVLPTGRLLFEVLPNQQYGCPVNLAGRYFDSEMLWLRDRTDTGIVGRSRLSRAPLVLQAALGLESFAASIWDNAAAPSGAYTIPPGMKDEGLRRLRANVEGYITGSQNAGRILYLDPQSSFTPISAKPIDAEVLESRKWGLLEVCRLFNVPPQIVHDLSHSSFSNSEQASRWFATNTLAPWVNKLEAEFARTVLDDPAYHLEISLDGLTRGAWQEQWATDIAAVQAGILRPDEVRSEHGYPPLPVNQSAPLPATPPVAAEPTQPGPTAP